MRVSEFDYTLPAELIAQHPPDERGASRLMRLDRESGTVSHHQFSDLPSLLQAGDLLVLNNTRVFPARLLGRRLTGGGRVEFLLLTRLDDDRWEALVHPGQKLKPGTHVTFDDVPSVSSPSDGPTQSQAIRVPASSTLHAEVLERKFFGRRIVRLWTEGDAGLEALIDRIGHTPLPPYIRRADTIEDRERYQTVYGRQRGSVAAPTAGLHFTSDLLATMRGRGIDLVEITLHVGYGTFKPVRTETVEEHRVDAETYDISEGAAAAIEAARSERRRVFAVGTTTVRALEDAALTGWGAVAAGRRQADLFIYPGFKFRVVDGLITNFHLPRSSLLMLVAAFAGREHVLEAYRVAIEQRYRFYSYGDGMVVS